ncbi:MAG: PspC family transcriptional regulator [Spirosomataceae bacterium]
MENLAKHIKYFSENQAFGVCTWLSDRMRISANSVRLYFIYTSFITMGSPVIVYLVLAFWMNIAKHLRQNNHPTVWEL